jgi:D-aspartate ligase
MPQARTEAARPPAVVLLPDADMVPTALGVIRCLGSAHIPVVTVGTAKRPMSSCSRYVIEHVRVPSLNTDAAEYLGQLRALGQRLGERPVLMVSADEHVAAVSRHADLLRDAFRYDFLSPAALRRCTDKPSMMAAALAAGIPVPKTVLVEDGEHATEVAQLQAPYIVKPASWVQSGAGEGGRDNVFMDTFRVKALRLETADELAAVLRQLAGLKLPVVVQEAIPGDATRLYTVALYSDATFNLVAAYTCVKVRQYPTEAGTGCCVRAGDVPELRELSRPLVAALEFAGIANIEYKHDPRDGTYRLIEINPRPGASIALSRAVGANLPLAAYACLTGTAAASPAASVAEAVWVDEWVDFVHCLAYHERGLSGCVRTWSERRHSLRGRLERAFAPGDDRLPGLVHGCEVAGLCLKAAGRRLARGVGTQNPSRR